MTTTTDPRDQQAWHRLHLTATVIVERLKSGQSPTSDQLLDLMRATEDVDGVLFSDWWDRETQPRQAPETPAAP